MKQATVAYCPQNPDWNSLPRIPIVDQLSKSDSPAEAWAQICRNDSELIVHLAARKQELRAEESGPLGAPCKDSCLEFFFSPIVGDLRYFNIECNPAGCLYVGFGSEPDDHMRLVMKEEQVAEWFHPEITLCEDGWDLVVHVPYKFIRLFFPEFAPKAGGQMRANFYNCGDLLAVPHHNLWNPITRSGKMRFHTPAEFGLLHFE